MLTELITNRPRRCESTLKRGNGALLCRRGSPLKLTGLQRDVTGQRGPQGKDAAPRTDRDAWVCWTHHFRMVSVSFLPTYLITLLFMYLPLNPL